MVENQTIEHLFYRCQRVMQFWNALTVLIQDKCQHAHNLRIDEKLVIFGMSQGIMTDQGLDKIIMWSKFHIYKS